MSDTSLCPQTKFFPGALWHGQKTASEDSELTLYKRTSWHHLTHQKIHDTSIYTTYISRVVHGCNKVTLENIITVT